jgi:hypothetical protein
MDFSAFLRTVESRVPAGTVLDNPGGGTTRIVSYRDAHVTYVRGSSRFRVSLRDLHAALSHFGGARVTSNDLKEFAPTVFDSGTEHPGHSCNCTLLFMLLREIGVVDQVHGRGVRGSPFWVDLRELAADLANIDERASEPDLPFEEVVKDLKRRGRI